MEENSKNLELKNELLLERIDALERLNEELLEQNRELIEDNNKQAKQLSILPSAKQKHREGSKALRYKMVTVMYADVKGFTKLIAHKEADALVDELDNFFFRFDQVVSSHNIEKIKSIGDTYIAAGGIPQKNRTNPIEVILASLHMQQYMRQLQENSRRNNVKVWDLNIGIHTGPVVANILGKKKISYDLKGDTVNIASRIESASENNMVYISALTYELVKDYFVCEYKGRIPVKIQGEIEMYTVKGFRPELSMDGLGLQQNARFRAKFQLVKYDDLEQIILDKLEKELPKHLYYHNLKHTIDVINGVEVIGSAEGVTVEEMLLLKTAAVFHDVGQITGSVGHEERGCELVQEMLPGFGYDPDQISLIKGIIMATKLPPTPNTRLERIICDADLDYLGRRDFIPVSDTLYRELKVQNIVGSFNDWNKIQVKFLSVHQFFTETALKLRQVNKESQVERIRALIKD